MKLGSYSRAQVVWALVTTLWPVAARANAPKASASDLDRVPERNLVAHRTHEPITIDGKATDAIWQKIPVSRGFRERNPELGAQDPQDTGVQIAYDDRALYVLITGKLSAKKPVLRTLRRNESSIWSDDAVTIKIDPAHDQRSTMFFAANLAGSQTDGMALNDGADFVELDNVWEVEGSHQDGRFILEYKIPWYALGVRGKENLVMGFNVSRDDPTRSATYDWRLIVPPRSPAAASTFGTVQLQDQLRTRPFVELTPYALARTDFAPRFSVDPRKSPNLAAGMDARLQTGPGGYVEASVLTDFSQVDMDEVQVAGNRFALYYPERRAFFLNGLDVFNFGYRGEAQLFFSRRIGMDGLVAPIAGGLKAYGRSQKLSYGILNVQTMRALRRTDDDIDVLERARENFSAARVRVQVVPQVALGVLGAGRLRMDRQSGDALQGGLDAEVRSMDTRFRGYAFVGGAWSEPDDDVTLPRNPSPRDNRAGMTASAQASYRGLYWRPEFRWLWSGEDFVTPVGFYRRPGTSAKRASLAWVPRPKFWGLQEIATGPEVTLTTTPKLDKMLTFTGNYELRLIWRNQWEAVLVGGWSRDRVRSDFSLYSGFEVPAGLYDNRDIAMGAASPSRLPVKVSAEYGVGPRFGGVEHRPSLSITARAGRHLSFTGTYNHRYGHLGDKSKRFNFGFANAQLILALSRNLAWDTLFRLNFSPSKEVFDIQSRIRWRYRPGSDIYLVYVRHTPLGDPRADDKMSQSITLKANFFFAAPVGLFR